MSKKTAEDTRSPEDIAEELAVFDAAEEEAFEAGFNATDQEPAAEEKTTIDEPIPADTEVVPVVEEKVKTAEEVLEEKYEAKFQQLHDKVFGKFGELKQKLEAIKPAATGLSPKAKERLMDEFPELAQLLFDEGSDVPDEKPVTVPDQRVSQKDTSLEDLEHNFERKLLKRDHKDWEQVVVSPVFAEWKSNVLSPEDASALDNSWDADFISAKITDFKKWQADKTADKETAAEKQDRLASAITPRGIQREAGISHSADDEEAAMVASYGRKK